MLVVCPALALLSEGALPLERFTSVSIRGTLFTVSHKAFLRRSHDNVVFELGDAPNVLGDFGGGFALAFRGDKAAQLHHSPEGVHLHVRIFINRLGVQGVLDPGAEDFVIREFAVGAFILRALATDQGQRRNH